MPEPRRRKRRSHPTPVGTEACEDGAKGPTPERQSRGRGLPAQTYPHDFLKPQKTSASCRKVLLDSKVMGQLEGLKRGSFPRGLPPPERTQLHKESPMKQHALTAGLALAGLAAVLSAQGGGGPPQPTPEIRFEQKFEAWYETDEGEVMREDFCAGGVNDEEADEYAEEFSEYGALGTSGKAYGKARILAGGFPCP